MKTRVLFILLSVLFIMPINAIPHKKHRHKVNAKIISSNYKVNTRSPLFFNLTADEVDDNLTITLPLPVLLPVPHILLSIPTSLYAIMMLIMAKYSSTRKHPKALLLY